MITMVSGSFSSSAKGLFSLPFFGFFLVRILAVAFFAARPENKRIGVRAKKFHYATEYSLPHGTK